MNKDTEILVIFTTEQAQALMQLLSQADVKGTASMRIVLGIEETLIQAAQVSQDKEKEG